MLKKIFNKDNTIYFIIFIYFLILFTLSPISGDDWGNHLIGKLGLYKCFSVALGMYFDWEGRLVSRILINILTYNKWLWNIVNSLIVTSIIYVINKITNKKNKIVPLMLSILTIFLMNIFMFSQVVVWLAGNITYLFPLAFVLIYIVYINRKNLKLNKYSIFVISIFNFLLPMFVEHMAGLLILINLVLFVLKSIKNKKIDKLYLLFLILSIASTIIMFLSPGSYKRSLIENVEFNELNIFEKVIYNIPNFINYTFIMNSFLIILLSITGIYLSCSSRIKKIYKIILILFFSVIPLCTVVLYNLNSFIGMSLGNSLINPYNIFVILYWVMYVLVILGLFLYNKDYNNIIFLLMGLVLNCIMLLSPTWGTRTSFGTYIFMIIPCISISSKLKYNKLIERSMICFTCLCALIFMVFYINIRLEQRNLERSIKKQLDNNNKVIEINSFPSYANCNINPSNDFHMSKFKEYYNIPSDKEVVLLPCNWRFIFIR